MSFAAILKRHPLFPLAIGILFVLSCICGKPNKISDLDSNSNQNPPANKQIKIIATTIRIGSFDLASSIEKKFDFKTYQGSALTSIDETINNPKDDAVIFVPFKKEVEIEVKYEETNISEPGIISGSYFQIIPDPKENKSNQDVNIGKERAYLIDKTRAVAMVSPWVWAPYNNGGVVKVALHLYTSSGEKFEREFMFKVGVEKEVPHSNQSKAADNNSSSTLKISKQDFGDKWAFTVEEGELSCNGKGGIGEVTFLTNGKTYALNGNAKETKRFLPIEEIWADNPKIKGIKKNISPFIQEGLKLCK